MKFPANKYILKIPDQVKVFYCTEKNILLIKNNYKQKILKLKVKIIVLQEKNSIIVTNYYCKKTSNRSKKLLNSLQGTTFSLIKKSFLEISTITFKKLKLVGVGYKAFIADENKNFLNLKLGLSHTLYYKIPKFIKLEIRQSSKIFIFGYDVLKVCQFASIIRNFKKPEPYKGKGILYSNESITLKEGKKI